MSVFCKVPFVSVRSADFYQPACVHTTNEKLTSLSDYLNSQSLSDLKEKYSDPNAKHDINCSKCSKTEAAGQPSYRTALNDKFKNDKPGKIVYYDVFPGNICNLQCIMCSPDSSTALAAEHKQLKWINSYKHNDYSDRVLKDIDLLTDLTGIAIIGGEFFLTKKNKEILKKCQERKLAVRIVTNGTIIDEPLFQLLNEIDNLELQISVDGIEEIYELIRYPAKWKDWQLNARTITSKLLNRADINFNCVVQPLNIQSIIPLLDHNNKLKVQTRLTWLAEPAWVSWALLNQEEKINIKNKLTNQLNEYKLTIKQKDRIEEILNSMDAQIFDNSIRKLFVSKFSQLVKFRKYDQTQLIQIFGVMDKLAMEVIDEICSRY